ncbi:MAG: septum formation protein Maf [Proteobacteria bacterium]|nr:MAG: septum formation protein Maf [Pseudomonadota bacterium]
MRAGAIAAVSSGHRVPTARSASLILASTSRYRRELLLRLGLPFAVEAPEVDESARPGERPEALALRLAGEKAHAVAHRHPQALVIGSDQAATLDGAIAIGKPGSHERAREQLRAASGRTMEFHTALCVTRETDGFDERASVSTRVRFRRLDDAEIDRYLQLEQPWDCAGAARVEGLGIALLEAVVGDDPTALIGLPLIALTGMLRRAGLSPLGG